MADKKVSELDQINNAADLTALSRLLVLQPNGLFTVNSGLFSSNLPNSINNGATGFGVAQDVTPTANTIPQNKTIVPLLLGSTAQAVLGSENRDGIVKILINKDVVPAVVTVAGINFTNLTLNGQGSSVTLIFLGGTWVILSAFNTTAS